MFIITTALACEAKPLISCFKLQRLTEINHLPVYHNEETLLVVTGVGKNTTITACSFILGYFSALNKDFRGEETAWLNVGIAGHSDLETGHCFLANKIINKTTGNTYYPTLIFDPPCILDNLYTVDQPNSDYEHKGGIDMEAAAFYETASRFSSSELIHSLKIVSDNPAQPLRKISKHEARDLVTNNLQIIADVSDKLKNLQADLPDLHRLYEPYKQIIGKFHFTQTEKQQLKTRLRKLSLLTNQVTFKKNISQGLIDSKLSKKGFLKKLDQSIDEQPIIF